MGRPPFVSLKYACARECGRFPLHLFAETSGMREGAKTVRRQMLDYALPVRSYALEAEIAVAFVVQTGNWNSLQSRLGT